MNPFLIADVDYNDPAACLLLRKQLISVRNDALGPDNFNSTLAVLLSHTIGLIGAFTVEKWPEAKNMLKPGES